MQANCSVNMNITTSNIYFSPTSNLSKLNVLLKGIIPHESVYN